MSADFVVTVKMENEVDYSENVCRLCDKICEQTYDIFEKTEGGKQIIQLIKEVLPIVIYRNDPLPKQICDLCFENLESSYQLRTTALETLSLQKERLRNGCADDEVDVFLQAVENGEVKQNGGIPESRDVATETENEDKEVFCKQCKSKVTEADAAEDVQPKDKVQMMNGAISHGTNSESELEVCDSDREVTQISSSKKRPLDESDLIAPVLKRRKIGPKSKTRSRNIVERIHFEPLSLLQCALNSINKANIPDYEPDVCEKVVDYEVEPVCLHCDEIFENLKLLALHESKEHIQVNLFDRVDDNVLWNKSREDASVRNRWLEDSLNEEETSLMDVKTEENLLVPIEHIANGNGDTVADDDDDGDGDENSIVLIDCKPYVNGVPLAKLEKEQRRALYKNIIVAGIKRKFCNLCRFTFKDNWAIELHYFTSACYYTCRYCGVRFNKQRHVFEEHVEDHIQAGHKPTNRIFAARKKNDPVPRIVAENTIKLNKDGESHEAEEEEEEDWRPRPKTVKPIKMKSLFQKTGYGNSNGDNCKESSRNEDYDGFPSGITVKREPGLPTEKDGHDDSQSQAYFCRKCYKVFFKLNEFNIHVKTCTGTGPNYRVERENSPTDESEDREEPTNSRGSAYSTSGRPIRNCVREVASYNDNFDMEVDSDLSHSNSPISGYQCNMCSSIFPTVQSRNSHMRIHKANMPPFVNVPPLKNQPVFRPKPQVNLAKQVTTNMMNKQKREDNFKYNYNDVYIKQEPMEPEVEIHEKESKNDVPSSIGNVSITPIPRASKPIKPLNPDIMRLVQNNPNITIRSMSKNNNNNDREQEQERERVVREREREREKRSFEYERERERERHHDMPRSNFHSQNTIQRVNLNHSAPSSSSYHNSVNNSYEDTSKCYRCSSCSKPFSNKSNLYFHKKNQCGGSRYPCPFCKKRFGTEAAYSSHIFYSHPE